MVFLTRPRPNSSCSKKPSRINSRNGEKGYNLSASFTRETRGCSHIVSPITYREEHSGFRVCIVLNIIRTTISSILYSDQAAGPLLRARSSRAQPIPDCSSEDGPAAPPLPDSGTAWNRKGAGDNSFVWVRWIKYFI